MQHRDYSALDSKIIEAIKNGKFTFSAIFLHTGSGVCRDVDRRLQALRKKGLITYTGQKTGWKLQENS